MGEEQLRLTLKKYVGQLEEGYALPIGGVADYYVEAGTVVELASAVSGAVAAGLPYLVIGTGKRVLFSDGGYPGLLIRNLTSSLVRSTDRSQVIVDSGVPLDRLVTVTAGWELGGLTSFFGQTATVGGALYADLEVAGSRLATCLRSVTVLMPPTRLNSEARIIRQSAGWLFDPAEEGSRLRRLRTAGDPAAPLPVLLAASLQLTSNRGGELMGRLRQSSSLLVKAPEGAVGPLFEALPVGNLDDLLRPYAKTVRTGACALHRRTPNYAQARGKMQASELRMLIDTVGRLVFERGGIRLKSRYEYLGVW